MDPILLFQLVLLRDGCLPQFLNDTIKMSLCPGSKWDDDFPVDTDFLKITCLHLYVKFGSQNGLCSVPES